MSKVIFPQPAPLREQLKNHYLRWQTCRDCSLGCAANRHVFYDYQLNFKEQISVMFIGEAPGLSEDKIGKPFVGRSGKLLREVISQTDRSLGWLITNVVACRPTDESGNNRPPEPSEILACRVRLTEVIHICNPLVIVAVGMIAQYSLPPAVCGNPISWLTCLHPSYLLRTGGKSHPQYYDQFYGVIDNAFETAYNHLKVKAATSSQHEVTLVCSDDYHTSRELRNYHD